MTLFELIELAMGTATTIFETAVSYITRTPLSLLRLVLLHHRHVAGASLLYLSVATISL
jgi:hypothetical protein